MAVTCTALLASCDGGKQGDSSHLGPIIGKAWQSTIEATKIGVEKTYEFFYSLFSKI